MIEGERVGAILAAAGTGTRAGMAKQWLELGGETVLARAARVLSTCELVDEIVAVVPPGDEGRAEALLRPVMPGRRLSVVAGGARRSESVRRGLDALELCELVLVHDAARPFASPGLVRSVALAAARAGAALAAVPSSDTVKWAVLPEGFDPVAAALAAHDGRPGLDLPRVRTTLDRREMWLAQTPQGFRTELLRRAFAAAGAACGDATDECALVERIGQPVALVAGEPGNFKITSPEDVARARAQLLPKVATGIGYDVHPFAPGRKLILGGVEFAGEGDGLLGHSDADICAHAIGDAILGAAGLGDIGKHFPDSDPLLAGVSSLVLLREITHKAREAGFAVGNCDVTLAARRPKIAPRAEEMRGRLAEAMGISPSQVNVKATTGERLGFVGRGEGIAAHAVALLLRID